MPDTNLDIFGRDRNHLLRGGDLFSRAPGGGDDGPKFPALPGPEADEAGNGLLSKAVSGLNYVGSTLDKTFGARAIRGVAAGKFHEALSIIPGSDTLGLTKPEDSVSMDDLLSKHHHIIAPNDPTKWEVRDFAVPLLEMAADPGSYINPFGAYTKAGKIASGLGHTQGMTRKALTQGFTHSESLLKAAGQTADQITHLGFQGNRILPESLELAAKAKGVDLGVGTPLRGSLGVGLPFGDAKDAFGTGRLSQGLAGGMDAAATRVKSLPGVPTLRALFDTSAGRSTHVGVQAANEIAGDPAREAVGATTRGLEHNLRTEMDALMAGHGAIPGAENEALRLIRAQVEGASAHYTDPHLWSQDLTRRYNTVLHAGTPQERRLAQGVTDVDAVRAHVLGNWHKYSDMAAKAKAFGDEALVGAENAGLWDNALNDKYAHYGARRYIAAAPGYGGADAAKQYPTIHGSNMHRKAPLRDIPGGSEQLNEWAMTPELSGPSRTLDQKQAADRIYNDMERHIYSMFPSPGPMPMATHLAQDLADRLKSARGKANEVAHWLGGVPDAHAAQGIPYFSPDIVGDLAMRGQRAARGQGSAAAVVRGSVDMARPASEFTAAGEKHVGLGDFLNAKGDGGLRTSTRIPRFSDAETLALANEGFSGPMHLRTVASNPSIATPWEVAALAKIHPDLVKKAQVDEHFGAGIRAYEQMAKRGFGPVGDAASGKTNWLAELNNFGLSEHDAGAMSKYLDGWTAPHETQGPLGFMGQAQTLFKNMVYPMWPASHVRNATSAVYNNYLHGTGIQDYVDAYHVLMHGRVADPSGYALTRGMTPEAAGAFLKENGYAHAKIGSGINQFTESVGAGGLNDPGLLAGLQGGKRLTPTAPGVHEPVREILARNGWKKSLNPLGQSGIAGQAEDTFAPLIAGRRVGTNIEDYVRMANYLGNMRGGKSSQMAGALTRAIHFDYTDLTPFEQNVMKSVIPFYTFMRKNLPYQAKMVATEPNKVAPLMHLTGQTDPNKEWKPEYLASGASIPLGNEADGTQRFLAKFGLPIEEAAERLKFRNYQTPWGTMANLPSASQTGMAYLGTGNPYLTGVAEYLTGKQFSTGRDLKDLYAKGLAGGYGLIPQEYAQPLTQAVAHSPLARFAGTADQGAQVIQGRKGLGAAGLNLFTGVKLTDVDMEKQRAIAMRKEIEREFESDPDVARFTNFYPKADAGPLSPDQVRRFRMFTKMKADAKAYHEAHRLKPGL